MAHRSVHYEAAFEDYLRGRQLPYVAVDEAKKALFAGAALKSFDFLVYSESGPNLLVDVKGRKFPDTTPGRRPGASRAWENWVTREDLESLAEWEKVFGPAFQAVLTVAYWLQGPPRNSPFGDVHFYKQKHYAFLAIRLCDYVAVARPRSDKWQTVAVPTRKFIELARGITTFL